jgi:hypothetical protein
MSRETILWLGSVVLVGFAMACGGDAGGDAPSADGGSIGPSPNGDAGESPSGDGGLDAPSLDADDSGSSDASLVDVSDGGAGSDAPVVDADAGAVVLSFDDLADGLLPSGHAGVTWDSDWYVYHAVPLEYLAHSGAQFVTNYVKPSPISFSFAKPVRFLGAWFSLRDDRNATVRFDLFDANDALIRSSSTLVQKLTPTFLDADTPNVKRVAVIFDVDFAMDDVTFIP